MLIDIHVHTTRYSTCGRSSPTEMLARAHQVGLEALVITEHGVIWSEEEIAEQRACFPQLVILRGIEVTSAEGDDYLVYGVTDPTVFRVGMDAEALVAVVKQSAGAIILAHPFRYGPDVPVVLNRSGITGIELLSNNIHNYAHHQAHDLAQRLGLPGTAASDGHHVDTLGMYGMTLSRPVTNERELARELRSRRFSMCVNTSIVRAKNALLMSRREEILRLLDQGLENQTIRERISGLSNTTLQGIREGRDVLWPESVQDGHARKETQPWPSHAREPHCGSRSV